MVMFTSKKILVVGLGLIGGSLAAALRRNGQHQVWGYDHDPKSQAQALDEGVIDHSVEDLEAVVRDVNVVVLAVPVIAMEALLRRVAPWLKEHTLLTDVGSVKGNIVRTAYEVFGKPPPGFVPGHPIAGSERSGISAVDPDLFVAHKFIITPLPESSSQAMDVLAEIWRGVGSDILTMDVARHDKVLAATSHLPHILAFSLVDTLALDTQNKDIFRYAAGGFRDFTRVSGSDPTMWHDVFVSNRDACLQTLDQFTDGLKVMRQAIADGDSNTMLGIMTRARVARHHFEKLLTGTAYTGTMTTKTHFDVTPGGQVQGRIRVPGDKSISHRSIMLGALAEGTTHISGFLEGEDALATLQAFRDMGVVIEGPADGKVTVHGVGLHGLQAPPGPLYVGNSGTTIRLLSGLLAGQNFDVELIGDISLNGRPMLRVANPLRAMGAQVDTAEGGTPPLKITGGQALKGIDYQLPMASAQVKSCVLLAGLYAEGETRVTEPAPTRDHTERMLQGFGYAVTSNGPSRSLQGGGTLSAAEIDVPSDISSATFFLVAAAITPDSDLLIEHVGMNPTRIGVINILRLMGADLDVLNPRDVGGEPVADLHIRYAPLKGIDVPEEQVALGIDEFPALMVAAACAQGTTTVTGAEELRVKESDRIQSMVDGLQTLGIDITGTPDGAVIVGKGGEAAVFGGGEIVTHHDHRIAMSFTVAGLRAAAPIKVLDCAHVATSFPGFVNLADKVGMQVCEIEELES
ncbi:MAG: bifunctional prephenate dehydrogenase/3-phosphoshikimate 1-carboxyvinyltransferase [Gammaproteobacteria bacterium]|nr:bifunctional prephenate dehydrogenase/3-phosphoshikimate 1-carboxyvinyltransferase [Gammaproteobacteria bacterium]MCP4880464.1 bifunctional prephenate dehydrogenase/3-phosphoshikimate 1-carboxyvinyltransferase [Gammaproteobacteria bacterium]